MAQEICGAWSERRQLRPAVDASKKMSMQGPGLAFVIMRKEFGAIGGDIHVRGAFRFARLAGKAKIERLLHMLISPGIADYLALQQLEKHVGAPASAVLLLHRDHVTGTHRAGMRFPAFSQAYAAHRCLGKGTAVIREVEMSFWSLRIVIRSQA